MVEIYDSDVFVVRCCYYPLVVYLRSCVRRLRAKLPNRYMSLTSSGKLSTRITADLPDSLDSPDSFTVKRRGKTVVDRGLDDPGTLEPPATTHPAMPDLGSAPLVLSSVAKTLVDRGEIQRSASNTTLVSNDDNHTTTTYDADVIIVGAGVVGASLASALARPNQPNAGLDRIPRRVLLIERSFAQPDRIVGELLQPGGVQALAQLGLHHVLADPPHSPQELNNTELADSISLENDVIDAVDCKGYAVFYKGEPVLLPYPNGQLGKSFHHGRFISNLRNECLLYPPPNHTEKEEAKRVDKGWIRCVEATVTGLEMGVTDRVTGVWASSSTSSDSTLYRAPIVVVCDGLYSRFRSTVTPTAPLPTVSSQFCGFILKDLALPYNEHGHVFLCDPSPVLMYRVSKSDTRVLVDLSEKKSGKALVDYLVNVVGPQLPLAVSEKFEIGARTQRLRQMPNSLLASTRGALKGVVHVGDARNMRHPLTGGFNS